MHAHLEVDGMVDGQVLVARVGGVAAAEHVVGGGGGGGGGAGLFVVAVRLRAEVEDEGDEDARQAQARPYSQGLFPHVHFLPLYF